MLVKKLANLIPEIVLKKCVYATSKRKALALQKLKEG